MIEKSQKKKKTLVIIGNNFVSDVLYNNYRCGGIYTVFNYENIDSIKTISDYIIDCNFKKSKIYETINYCNDNNVEKLLIINHYELPIPKTTTIILQHIVYDIYGNKHFSFNREDFGNAYDDMIHQNNLISEAIRRIHISHTNFIPLTYLPYGEEKIRFIHVNNLHETTSYMLATLQKNYILSVFDEEISIGSVINTIKNEIGYTGEVIILDDEPMVKHKYAPLLFKQKKNTFEYEIKKIYKYLISKNKRFDRYELKSDDN